MDKKQKRKKKLEERAKRKASLEVKRFPLTTVQNVVQENACGECQACCEMVAVHEIDKPMFTRCQHQCESGCGIYEERPESCRTYHCLYRLSKFGVEFRPDKLGIILEVREMGGLESKEDVISAWEVWEGAADEPLVAQLLENVSKNVIVYIRRYKSSKRRIMGPEEKVRNIKGIREYM